MELSSNEFQALMHTLGNWRIFVARERLAKLMERNKNRKMHLPLKEYQQRTLKTLIMPRGPGFDAIRAKLS